MRGARVLLWSAVWALAGCLNEVKLGDIPADGGDASAADARGPLDADALDAELRLDAEAGALDAMPSPSPSPDAGVVGEPYSIRFERYPASDMPVSCTDDLAGMEGTYVNLRPDECGLVEGDIFLSRQSQSVWIVSGDVIREGFGFTPIRLVDGFDPNAPPGLMVAEMTYSVPGPLGTTRQAEILGLDRDSSTASTAVGIAGVELQVGSSVGSCFITFGVQVQKIF